MLATKVLTVRAVSQQNYQHRMAHRVNDVEFWQIINSDFPIALKHLLSVLLG